MGFIGEWRPSVELTDAKIFTSAVNTSRSFHLAVSQLITNLAVEDVILRKRGVE